MSNKFKGLSSDALYSNLLSLKRELMILRFKKSVGELSDTSVFKKTKRNIARVMTELSVVK